MTAGLVLVVLALLPLAVWVVVTVRPGLVISTRTLPADVARITVMVAFVAWVNPYWGICAALAACHWLRRGWTMVEGGILWPTLAMAAWLGLAADARWLDAALAIALTVGVLETGLAVAQWAGVPIFMGQTAPRVGRWRPRRLVEGEVMVHGTFGHRTGLGIALAMLVPLGFLTDYGWPLAAIYAVGLLLTKSLVAWAAAVAGIVVLGQMPWAAALPVAAVGIGQRLFVWRRGVPHALHWNDSWRARWHIWITVYDKLCRWPNWLVGHGAFAFSSDARQWFGRTQMREVFKEAHNDYVEFAYEYGVLGCAAMSGWAVTLYPAVAWRDPVTASAAALSVAMLGQFPLKVAPVLGIAGLVVVTLMRRVA